MRDLLQMFIPGRIEFLGKHTDYCGGRSIVCAIDRGFHIEMEPILSAEIKMENLDTGEKGSVPLVADAIAEGPAWMHYVQTVARRLSVNFTSSDLRGVSVRFRSDLPQAAGLSSSSALIVGVFSAVSEINSLETFPEYTENISDELNLADYLGCIENGRPFGSLKGVPGVGTFGGSQDHAAIIATRSNTLTRFAYCPVSREADFAFPESLVFVVASSGVKAEKTAAAQEKYNRVSLMVSDLVSAWRGEDKTLASIIESAGIDEVERFIRVTPFAFPEEEMIERVRHFYSENYALIDQFSELVSRGDFERVGGLIDLSQRNAERYLRNQTEETIHLQRSARNLGAIAASAFGAGFGGSVYALINSEAAPEFSNRWRASYIGRFPVAGGFSEFFTARISQLKSSEI